MDKREDICLFCLGSVKNQVKFKDESFHQEILNDLFSILCKYMDWKQLDQNFQFDFRADLFPTCKSCLTPVLQLCRLHREIQQLLRKTQQITLKLSVLILESSSPDGTKNAGVQSTDSAEEGSRDHLPGFKSKRCGYYRNFTKKCFNAKLIMSKVKQPSFERKNQQCGQVAAQESPGKTQDFRESLEEEDDDVTYEPFEDTESESDQDSGSEVNENKFEAPLPLIPEPELPSTDDSQFPEDCLETPYRSDKMYFFSRSTYKDRVRQIGEALFVFDDKRSFELVNGEWKCHHCGFISLDPSKLFTHFVFVKKPCFGSSSKLAVKEHQYKNIVYDQLRDDSFECRLCNYKGQEIEQHIDQKHSSHFVTVAAKLKKMWTTVAPNHLRYFDRHDVFVVEDPSQKKNKTRKLKCGSCNFSAETKGRIELHIKQKHGNARKSKQRIGKDEFVTGGGFSFAFRDTSYHCQEKECKYECVSYHGMLLHFRLRHTDKLAFVCQICGAKYNRNYLFQQHMQQRHGEGSGFTCDKCGKFFRTNHRLKVHFQNVHAERNNICDICGRKYSSKHNLNEHIHNYHETVTCQDCGIEVKRGFLKTHMLKHSPDKRFKCKNCEKEFRRPACLSIHRLSCGGEKRFTCDICNMKFTQSYSVTRHKKVAH